MDSSKWELSEVGYVLQDWVRVELLRVSIEKKYWILSENVQQKGGYIREEKRGLVLKLKRLAGLDAYWIRVLPTIFLWLGREKSIWCGEGVCFMNKRSIQFVTQIQKNGGNIYRVRVQIFWVICRQTHGFYGLSHRGIIAIPLAKIRESVIYICFTSSHTNNRMQISDFTGLITSAQVLDLLGYLAIVFGGIIAVVVVLSPLFFAKMGFNRVLNWVSSAIGVNE